ncbi:MAG: aspartyl protease family protein [Verrucomicrobiae bacterium]|nr:aspartyl protease family protein [Verrucomicrobiae bacterium]
MRFVFSLVLATFAAVARGEMSNSVPAEFPFQLREGLLWVEVNTPESAKPLNFLLDTGAEVSVINLSTAKRLGFSLAPKVKVRGVHASMTGYWPQKLSATTSGVALPADFLAVDLSKLSRSCEKPLDGLIGADFFRGKVVQIDFAAQKVRLLTVEETSSAESALPLDLRHCGMRVQASVNGSEPQWLRVDTGCATSLHWVTRNVRPKECSSKVAIGLAKLNIPQKSMSVNLGEHTFQDVPTGLHRTAIFPGEAGLLGNGLLSRFSRVTIDAKAGRLILEGNPAQ